MTSQLSKKYKLLPTLDPNAAPLSPSAYFPAIPIKFIDSNRETVFATFDINLQVSLVDPDLADDLYIKFFKVETEEKFSDTSGIITSTIIILEPNLQPWLRFDKVPFSIISDARKEQDQSKVILGYKSLLAYLRLAIDYPKRTFTLTGQKRFLFIPETTSRSTLIPQGVVEAERLIRSGSYSSGSALLVASLEQWVLQSIQMDSK